jgi:outer membrane immunogenic protein
MRRHFGWALATAVSLAGLGAASAADMAVKARPPVPVAVYNWTGCYIGGSVGGKFASTRDTVFVPATANSPASSLDLGRGESDTWIAGGQVGCNYQTGKWVFGIEGDAHAQRWSRSQAIAGVLPFPFIAGDIYELRSDWQASLRGRVGYAWDRTMLYATGGVAFTEVRAYTNWIPFGIFPATLTWDTKTLVGGTVGIGVEHAVTNNFTVGLEGRYSYYGNQRFNAGPLAVVFVGGAFTSSPTYRDVRVETAEVMLKANWKFGPGAVVAKY